MRVIFSDYLYILFHFSLNYHFSLLNLRNIPQVHLLRHNNLIEDQMLGFVFEVEECRFWMYDSQLIGST